MRGAVAGQCVLPWSSRLPFLPFQDTWHLERGTGEAGPGAWPLYIPAPLILGSFNIIYYLTTMACLPCLSPNRGLLPPFPLYFSACLSCCPLSPHLHLWGPASVSADPVLKCGFLFLCFLLSGSSLPLLPNFL